MLALSTGLRAHAWLLGAAAVGHRATLGVARTQRAGRPIRDRWLLRVPGLGDLLAKAAVARAARTLGTLLACGVAILDALDVAAARRETGSSRTPSPRRGRASRADARWRSLSASARPSRPMVRQMIAVGEATGTLDVMLARVADCYDDEVHAAAPNLLALLEPALILFLGVVVGGLVVSMYLPIFRLGAVLG